MVVNFTAGVHYTAQCWLSHDLLGEGKKIKKLAQKTHQLFLTTYCIYKNTSLPGTSQKLISSFKKRHLRSHPKIWSHHASLWFDDIVYSTHNKFRRTALFLSLYYSSVKCLIALWWPEIYAVWAGRCSPESINNKHFFFSKNGKYIHEGLVLPTPYHNGFHDGF